MRLKTVLVALSLVLASSTAAFAANTNMDMNEAGAGGSADLVIVRAVGGNGEWWSGNGATPDFVRTFGTTATDFFLSGDFDGDGKDDTTVWRAGAAGVAGFYIYRSTSNTAMFVPFGQTGDTPTVIGDWNGDGTDDLAVYRDGAGAGAQSTFFWASLSSPTVINYVPWGINSDFPFVGDFDGDGKVDPAVQRAGAQGQIWIRNSSSGSTSVFNFGLSSDAVTAGQFVGGSNDDVAVLRNVGGQKIWYIRDSQTGAVSQTSWGVPGDTPTPADYDGDGIKDIAIWRGSTGQFWIRKSSGSVAITKWGATGDFPVANWSVH